MRRILSLLLCLCMICTMSVTVFGASNFWTNSLDAEMQRVIMRTNGNELTIEVLTYDGEDIYPAGTISNNSIGAKFIELKKGDYSWSGSVAVTEDSIISVVDINISGSHNYMIKPVHVKVEGSGIYIYSGDYSEKNDVARERMYSNSAKDIIAVNPIIQKKADEICTGLTSDIDKARAIYLWIGENIAYDYTAYNNGLTSQLMYPSDILLKQNAVCGGLSQLYKVMCNSQGIPCKVVGGSQGGTTNSSGYGHAWNEFYTKGGQGVSAGWYLVDCTACARLAYNNGTFSENFDKDDKFFSYFKSCYFMPDKEFIDTYFIYASELPYNLSETDAANISDWAAETLTSARDNGLLVEGLILDDYTQTITRDYFADLIVQFIKCEYVNGKLSKANINSKDYGDVLMNSRSEIESILNEIAKQNPVYTGERMGMSPSAGTKKGMAFCNQVGIIAGKGDAGLCPNDTLTRAEAATMIVRLATYMKEQGYTSDKFDLKSFGKINSSEYFRDHMDIPEWALEGCYACKDKGIIKGDENNRFLPNNEITAEQCIAIFTRLLNTK